MIKENAVIATISNSTEADASCSSAVCAETSTRWIVLTSIRRPSPQVHMFLRQSGWRTVFVADLKTPSFEVPDGMDLLSVDRQVSQKTNFSCRLPWRHYARKNMGYLHAIAAGATEIFDTDDDNAPIEPWTPQPTPESAVVSTGTSKWVNVYDYFGGDRVWPRGFPLEEIHRCSAIHTKAADDSAVVVWQGLVEGDPDVDAIFRLTRPEEVRFRSAPPMILDAGRYCPFNSQNTWWSRQAFPYLYLPSTVSFRFTDILRGFVAQRCFWAHGWRLGFQATTARQERNPHDLIQDFRDEIIAYTETSKIIGKLDSLSLNGDAAQNLRSCYSALTDVGYVQPNELDLVESWLESMKTLCASE